MKEYLDRVFSGISTNTELENLQPGIGNHRDKKICFTYIKILFIELVFFFWYMLRFKWNRLRSKLCWFVGLLLVSQAKSVIAMKKAVSNVKDKLTIHKQMVKDDQYLTCWYIPRNR